MIDKKKMYRHLKQGYMVWEEYKDAVQTCRDGIRKAKAQMESKLIKDVKNKEKRFCSYIGQKRQAEESVLSYK